jgi:hypothetical protein
MVYLTPSDVQRFLVRLRKRGTLPGRVPYHLHKKAEKAGKALFTALPPGTAYMQSG